MNPEKKSSGAKLPDDVFWKVLAIIGVVASIASLIVTLLK